MSEMKNDAKGGMKLDWDERTQKWVNSPGRTATKDGATLSDGAKRLVEENSAVKLAAECPRSTFTPILDLIHFWLIPEETVNTRKVFIPSHAVPGVSNGPTCVGLVIAVGPDVRNVKVGDEVLLNNVAKMVDHRGLVGGVIKENMLMGIVRESERFTKRPPPLEPTGEMSRTQCGECAGSGKAHDNHHACPVCEGAGVLFSADAGCCGKLMAASAARNVVEERPEAWVFKGEGADPRQYLPTEPRRE